MCTKKFDLSLSANMPMLLSAEKIDGGHVKITAHWDGLCVSNPVLTVSWQRPMADIQFEWYPGCRFNRSLHVDWNAPVMSKISSSAPVYCFYNASGRNRFTLALSDAKTLLGCGLGVREEDGTLVCKVEIPLDATGITHDYSVVLYRDESDVSFAEALRRVSSWWENECAYSPMAVPDIARQPLYSCWYSFHQATIAQEIEEECARAADLGMKVVIVDDGWQTEDGQRGYAFCGDWDVAACKIPDMQAHVANVHALGMKYMLWYSVPFVGMKSKAWDRFSGRLLNVIDRLNAGVLDPRYPDVREYLINIYETALKAWDLDGFKLDFIDSISSGSNPVPPVTPEMDYVLVEDAVERLMADVMCRLRAIKPDILIEFRQSYIGPVMRTFGNMFRVGDCPYDALSNRVGTVDLRLLSGNTAVHSDMLMWHCDDIPEAVALQMESILFAVPQISVKLERISSAQREVLSFWLNFMCEHREVLQFAPLEVCSPENLYSLVKAEQGNEAIIALYAAGTAVDLPAKEDIWLVNATFEQRIIVCSEEKRSFRVQILDCRGRVVEERVVYVDGVLLMNVPRCGAVHFVQSV